MKSITLKLTSQSGLDIEYSSELLKAPEDEFTAFLEDSIQFLQSQLLSSKYGDGSDFDVTR